MVYEKLNIYFVITLRRIRQHHGQVYLCQAIGQSFA
jgi:hypothetical protein